MGFEDRRYNQNAGNWRAEPPWKRALRRVFADGDDFFGWGVSIARVWGIDVRVHLFFIVYILIELVTSLVSREHSGLGITAARLGTLFAIVLIHEFGHCFACRWVGGSADRIVLWPLGGLASVAPPRNWKASLITTLGGPAVHLLIAPVLVGVMLLMGAPTSVLVFNPFNASAAAGDFWFAGPHRVLRLLIWSAHLNNAALFLFNMLLVMFPMDAGRVVQELLWSRLGYKRSMEIATTLGLVMAVIVGMVAIVAPSGSGLNILLGIAIFGGLTCFTERRRLAMLDDYNSDDPWTGVGSRAAATASARDKDFAPGATRGRSARSASGQSGIDSEVTRRQTERAEVDRILEKVGREGLASLTKKERNLLKLATDRQRQQEQRASRG